jgi:hypothetical protein
MSMITELIAERMGKESQTITALPKPRKLDLHWKGKLAILLVLLVITGILHWLYSLLKRPELNINTESHLSTIIMVVVIFVCCLAFIGRGVVNELREVALLRAGECGVGKILSHRRIGGGRGAWREVIYSFPVGRGKPMTGRGKDRTFHYSKDQPILVFYDPLDISHHVAYCSTWWRNQIGNGVCLEP